MALTMGRLVWRVQHDFTKELAHLGTYLGSLHVTAGSHRGIIPKGARVAVCSLLTEAQNSGSVTSNSRFEGKENPTSPQLGSERARHHGRTCGAGGIYCCDYL